MENTSDGPPPPGTILVRIGRKHDQLAYGAGNWGAPMCLHAAAPGFQTGDLISNSLNVSDPVFDDFYPRAMAAAGTEGVKKIFREANEHVARRITRYPC